ncbi:zinc finger protein 644 [Astyanax mexicanus]|uniref:Zinc finger protein 644 n=1 Tax=Astyanax mexicanus TaxID=7994 RepID=A0A8T2M0F9_ASTMX|nr:zinc finger protein 644 [Astyanax mexicanus]
MLGSCNGEENGIHMVGTQARPVFPRLDGASVCHDKLDGASIMAAVKESADEEKEVEPAEDYIQELSGSHTSSPTTTNNNNISSVGPQQCQSLDTHQSLLNGAQPSPFVCGGVPAAPCTDDSLPSGALVNGPASHCTSEEPHVPNKDASPWPGTDTNPEVLQPPSELQSDTWQKPEGHVLKAPSARTSSESDSSDREASADVLVGDAVDNGPISRLWTRKSVKTGFLWDVDSESSESSSEDYEDLNRGLQKKFMRLLFKGRVMGGVAKRKTEADGSALASPSRRKRKMCRVERIPAEEEVNDGFSSASITDGDLDLDLTISKENDRRRETESLRAYMDSRLGNSRDKAAVVEKLVRSEKEGRHDEGHDVGEADAYVGGKLAHLKSRLDTGKESESMFFQCSKCNINFKEKKHLHRHLMYHLDRHNQVGQESVLRPFICKECGRSFRERSTLHKHMQIHQARRERLMQEIKGLNKPREEQPGLDARLRCSQYAFGTSCPATFDQHAAVHEKDEGYHFCDECDYTAMTELDMEAHQWTAHLSARQDRFFKSFDAFVCKICTFRTKKMSVLRKHLDLVHKQPLYDYDHQSHKETANEYTSPMSDQVNRLTGQTEADASAALSQKPKFLKDKQNGSTEAGLSMWSNGDADLYVRDKGAQKSGKGLSSPLIKWSFGSLANNLSPSSLRCDKPSKLYVPTERIDVTTGLPYVEEDNQAYESTVSEQKTKYLSSFNMHLATKTGISSKTVHLNEGTANTPKDPSERGAVVGQVLRQKSPSKRKMSIPYHNTPENPFLKREAESPEWLDTDPMQEGDFDDDDDDPNNDNYHNYITENWILDGSEDGHSPYISDQFIQQDFSLKEDSSVSVGHSDHDGYMEDDDEIYTFIVKEESIESAVIEDNPEFTDENFSDSYTSYRMSPVFEIDRKSCPYCPAVFESGVGLSNHVRGHLHRLGLSYDARHMLSAEQVASQDRQPRIRRRAPSFHRRIRKDKSESQTEHTCPLCLGWFDTKTGLSNHVRGHLKRIGKPISGVSKSPLSILTELLQDENEHRKILRSLQAKPRLSRSFISQKFTGSDGLFLTPTGVPVKVRHQWPSNGLDSEEKKKTSREINETSETSSSSLVELLKRKRQDVELQEDKGDSQAARTRSIIPSFKTVAPADLPAQDQNSSCSQEKLEINKKICIHCNATFHSAVSLSNHLRAYTRRKRLALIEGTSYDCNQVRPRARPGPKRKDFPSPHTASEVIYTLTCRFCDLVFQGPQSVQEDWVKHLQRHLMHTSVPGTGAGMAEVTAECEEPCDPSLDSLPFPQLSQGLS